MENLEGEGKTGCCRPRRKGAYHEDVDFELGVGRAQASRHMGHLDL